MQMVYLPRELVNVIFEYDGRIKYRNGTYVNIIHKHHENYSIIQPVITKKIEIMKTAELSGSGFYFDIKFNNANHSGLVYDYNFSYTNTFEICYYNMRNSNIIQIRTYL